MIKNNMEITNGPKDDIFIYGFYRDLLLLDIRIGGGEKPVIPVKDIRIMDWIYIGEKYKLKHLIKYLLSYPIHEHIVDTYFFDSILKFNFRLTAKYLIESEYFAGYSRDLKYLQILHETRKNRNPLVSIQDYLCVDSDEATYFLGITFTNTFNNISDLNLACG